METFIVRLWQSTDSVAEPEAVRGVVEHVATGDSTTFAGPDELVEFLGSARAAEAEAKQKGESS